MHETNERFETDLSATIDVYNRTADVYATTWDGFVSPKLELLASAAGSGPILDAGCGPGRDLAAFSALGVPAVGVDLSLAMCELARQTNSPVVPADVRCLPFADACFTAVWASASLVHLDDQAAFDAMTELGRVTAPGAAAFVNVKARSDGQPVFGWEGEGPDARCFRYWTLAEFGHLVAQTGWVPVAHELCPDSRRPGLAWVEYRLKRPA